MNGVEHYKEIFERYGGMMRTNQLEKENILYRKIQQLIQEGYIEKVRYGYYQWVDQDDFSEISTINRLFPDAILCMETALRYYGYSDRTPGEINGHCVRIYDKDRVICDCLRYRNKMDKEIFNKAIQGYISDTSKSIPRLMEYAAPLRVKKIAKDLIGVWL